MSNEDLRMHACMNMHVQFYSAITIDMVGTDEPRVTISDRKQANEIVYLKLYTLSDKDFEGGHRRVFLFLLFRCWTAGNVS